MLFSGNRVRIMLTPSEREPGREAGLSRFGGIRRTASEKCAAAPQRVAILVFKSHDSDDDSTRDGPLRRVDR